MIINNGDMTALSKGERGCSSIVRRLVWYMYDTSSYDTVRAAVHHPTSRRTVHHRTVPYVSPHLNLRGVVQRRTSRRTTTYEPPYGTVRGIVWYRTSARTVILRRPGPVSNMSCVSVGFYTFPKTSFSIRQINWLQHLSWICYKLSDIVKVTFILTLCPRVTCLAGTCVGCGAHATI